MRKLLLALYAEGTTDEQFLPSVLQRTSRQILARYERKPVYVDEPKIIPRSIKTKKRDECILEAAHYAVNYDILVIHSDADYPTSDKALTERFLPGYELVQQAEKHACKHLVPIVPIYMTEAWMLADHEALREVIGTSMSAHELGLPAKAKQVEADPNPKQTLNLVLQKAYSHRPKRQRSNQLDLRPLYALLGRQVSLERLNHVPAYQQFVNDLTETLKKLNLVQQ